MSTSNRRVYDSKEQHDIERLIEQENDPKVRLHLMILNRLHLCMVANTESTKEVANMVTKVGTKLDEHLTNYEEHTKQEQALINKGRGAWRVIAWVIGAVQVIGLGIWVKASEEITHMTTVVHVLEQTDARLDTRITVLEKIK